MIDSKQRWLTALAASACLFLAALTVRADDDDKSTNAADATAATNAVTTATSTATSQEDSEDKGRVRRDDVVEIGHDAELRADEVAGDVVSVFGSTSVAGHAHGDVVAVFGNVDLRGKADGNCVAVFGSVHAASNAVVGGDTVSVGGVVDREPGATFHGRVQQTAVGLPGLGNMTWLTMWFRDCLRYGRPMSFKVGWVWAVAGVMFLFYLLIAAAFPGAVRPCVEALNTRPVTSLAVGLIGKFAVAIIYLLLAVTVVGLFIIPFIQVGLIVALFVGKVAILERIGSGLGKATNASPLQRPVLAFILGAVIVTFIYTVPILGFLTFLLITVWGQGAAVTAAYVRMRGERPPKPPTPVTPIAPTPSPVHPSNFTSPIPGTSMLAVSVPSTSSSEIPPSPAPETASTPPLPQTPPLTPPPLSPPPLTPHLPATLAYPRGGFWPRMAAAALDCVLLLIVSLPISHGGPGLFFLAALAYFSGMIAWKGTTIGGIILRLHVVRSDGRPVNILVAIIRALSAFFSVLCLFLGFFWIGWDNEKQGWHDKIAGTVVVRLPHAPSLLVV